MIKKTLYEIVTYPVVIKTKKSTLLYMSVAVIIMLVFHWQSVLTIPVYLCILLLYNKLVIKETREKIINFFSFYLMVSCIIYMFQYITFPSTLGLTTTITSGKGGDDIYFYGDAAFDLSNEFPYHPQFMSIGNLDEAYTKLLRIFTFIFHFFFNNNPLDLLGLNVLFISIMPIYAEKIFFVLGGNKGQALHLSKMVMLCPFINIHSLILLRDGIITLLFVQVIYGYLKKKYIFMISSLFAILVFRPGTFIIVSTIVVIEEFISLIKRGKIKYTELIVIVSAVIFLAVFLYFKSDDVIQYIASRVLGGIGKRFTFSEETEMSVAGKLPSILKYVALTIIMFVSPTLSMYEVIVDGIFVPRSFLLNIIYPIVFSLSLPAFVYGVKVLIQTKKVEIVRMYSLGIFLIAIVSMQVRHKTMLMPIYYIIVEMGLNNTKSNKKIIFLMGLIFLMMQGIYLMVG